MKNVHVLPTDKPSRLSYVICTEKSTLTFFEDEMEKGKRFFPQNIYITSDEDIKKGEYQIYNPLGNFDNAKVSKAERLLENDGRRKKIILTTDLYLIKNGVKSIDDVFLEWFVKNPSCEFVEVKKENICSRCYSNNTDECWSAKECSDGKYDKTKYTIIIPQEEPKQETSNEAKKRAKNYMKLKDALNNKQETLEEAAENNSKKVGSYAGYQDFIEGANWQAKRMYNEEDMVEFSKWRIIYEDENPNNVKHSKKLLKEWFEQHKKK
jgi:hypothetical protein